MIMVLSAMSVFADGTTIKIDGNTVSIPAEMGSVTIKEDRTFVPVRFVMEHFDYEVAWNSTDESVLGRNVAGDIFVMQVNNPLLIFKGADNSSKTINMDVVPYLNNVENRTYIPIRFLAEVLGYEVGWEEETSTVTLDKK